MLPADPKGATGEGRTVRAFVNVAQGLVASADSHAEVEARQQKRRVYAAHLAIPYDVGGVIA